MWDWAPYVLFFIRINSKMLESCFLLCESKGYNSCRVRAKVSKKLRVEESCWVIWNIQLYVLIDVYYVVDLFYCLISFIESNAQIICLLSHGL